MKSWSLESFLELTCQVKSFLLLTAQDYYLHHSHCWVDLWWQRYVNLVLVPVNPEMRVKVTIQKKLHGAQLY